MAESGFYITIKFKWWFKYLYFPAMVFSVKCFGIKPNMERFERIAKLAMIIE